MITSNPTIISQQRAENFLLKERQNGYWAYTPGGDASLETSAWCAIAFRSNKDIRDESWQYFKQSQNKHGGWSTGLDDGSSDWTSNLVLLALRIMAEQAPLDSGKQALLNDACRYLIQSRSKPYPEYLRWILQLFKLPATFPSGRGWPFLPGTAMLVEPTSYALMAVSPTKSANKEPLKSIVSLGQEYLFSRYCQRGGWNYGENVRITEQLPAYPVSTAQAIIALQDKPQDKRIQTGLMFLTKTARENNTVMALSWSAMARNCLGEPIQEELSMLIKHHRKDGSFGNSIYLTALAVLALQCQKDNALRFPAASQVEINPGNL